MYEIIMIFCYKQERYVFTIII